MTDDAVFRALADPSRRLLLDRLYDQGGQTLGALCRELAMTRQAVAKHLAILEAANLVATRRQGREKLHFLNPVPINEATERWIGKFDQQRLAALSNLKRALQGDPMPAQAKNTPRNTFVYVTFIRTTPERLWAALTDPATVRQYWFGMHQESDWTPGSPWRMVRDNGDVTDSGEILEANAPNRLVIKWRNEFRPDLTAEGYSRCTYELEPVEGGAVKLSVVHEIDAEGGKFIEAVSGGWPRILSNLKSLLETGQTAIAA
jgi:uncharacterized protein YndB with AHSA1/START domain/DNA-binding transcriptional ArsR family regulator